jgi:NADP-dependent 3-hydroxy acid dehydrogenase YdfG
MKTWLITGCSSGFGQRLALAAAQRGDRVIATARNVKTIEEMAEPFGGRTITLPRDVTDAAAAKTAVAKSVETSVGIDVLVNNAGYGLFGAIEEGTPEEYRPKFEVNVFGLIETTRAALSVQRSSGGTRQHPTRKRS